MVIYGYIKTVVWNESSTNLNDFIEDYIPED